MVTGINFIITPRYEEWLLHGRGKPIPKEIIDEVMSSLASGYQSSGRNAFNPTSAGLCKRRQIFGFLRLPKEEVTDTKLLAIFDDGDWRHYRWQIILLYITVLDSVEDRVYDALYKVSGRLDGVGTVPRNHPNRAWRRKKFAFELKGVNPYQYAKTTWEKFKGQVVRCFRARRDIDLYVIIVENKGTQEYREWVITREDVKDLLREEREELRALNRSVRREKLPPLLSVCRARKGDIWEKCPYGGVGGTCYKYKDARWPGSG